MSRHDMNGKNPRSFGSLTVSKQSKMPSIYSKSMMGLPLAMRIAVLFFVQVILVTAMQNGKNGDLCVVVVEKSWVKAIFQEYVIDEDIAIVKLNNGTIKNIEDERMISFEAFPRCQHVKFTEVQGVGAQRLKCNKLITRYMDPRKKDFSFTENNSVVVCTCQTPVLPDVGWELKPLSGYKRVLVNGGSDFKKILHEQQKIFRAEQDPRVMQITRLKQKILKLRGDRYNKNFKWMTLNTDEDSSDPGKETTKVYVADYTTIDVSSKYCEERLVLTRTIPEAFGNLAEELATLTKVQVDASDTVIITKESGPIGIEEAQREVNKIINRKGTSLETFEDENEAKQAFEIQTVEEFDDNPSSAPLESHDAVMPSNYEYTKCKSCGGIRIPSGEENKIRKYKVFKIHMKEVRRARKQGSKRPKLCIPGKNCMARLWNTIREVVKEQKERRQPRRPRHRRSALRGFTVLEEFILSNQTYEEGEIGNDECVNGNVDGAVIGDWLNRDQQEPEDIETIQWKVSDLREETLLARVTEDLRMRQTEDAEAAAVVSDGVAEEVAPARSPSYLSPPAYDYDVISDNVTEHDMWTSQKPRQRSGSFNGNSEGGCPMSTVGEDYPDITSNPNSEWRRRLFRRASDSPVMLNLLEQILDQQK